MALLALVAGAAAACSGGAPATFTLKGASVDSTYDCPAGATDAPYSVRGVIDMRNGTASNVAVRSIAAVMTLVAVKGTWLEKVGDRFEASGVTSSVTAMAASSSASTQVIIASSCTGGTATGSEASYGEYSVGFTVTTSTGIYSIQSSNHHRIVAG